MTESCFLLWIDKLFCQASWVFISNRKTRFFLYISSELHQLIEKNHYFTHPISYMCLVHFSNSVVETWVNLSSYECSLRQSCIFEGIRRSQVATWFLVTPKYSGIRVAQEESCNLQIKMEKIPVYGKRVVCYSWVT